MLQNIDCKKGLPGLRLIERREPPVFYEARAMSVALRSSDTPAADAAKLLIRLGLAIILIGLPCTGVFWRGAIYVLLPVGGALILIGAALDAPEHKVRRLRATLVSPAGATALFLAFWACLSLIWTPFPGEAGDRFLKLAGATFLAVLVAVFLPEKTRTLDLYLLPVGLALASVATLVLALFGPPWFLSTFAFDETLFERSMVTLIVFIWPALGILSLREHWIAAAVLAVLIAAVALAGFAQIALLAMGAGAFTFAMAMSGPAKTARILAWVIAPLILIAPALPLLYRLVLRLAGFDAGAGSAPMLIWADLVSSQWLRLITGHGLDFANRSMSLGYLPDQTPKSLLFVIWYDFGLVGAVGFAVLIAQAFAAAGRVAAQAAPAVLAGLVTVLTIAFLGIATAQIWWVTLLDCVVIAFALLAKGIHKAHRPDVEAIRAIETEAQQEPSQDGSVFSNHSPASL